jgi:serine kinase of HPr protein (carbohydrate metabolism regulator)
MIKIMFVRGIGVRDISTVLKISVTRVLKVLKSGTYVKNPKKKRYDCLETDEVWTYAGKLWRISRENGT